MCGQVKALLEEILERVTDEFNIPELMARVEERTPYIVVALQECERMNTLTREIRRSLRELHLGLKVREDLGGKDIASWALLRRKWHRGSWELEDSSPATIQMPSRVSPQKPESAHVCKKRGGGADGRGGKTQGIEA